MKSKREEYIEYLYHYKSLKNYAVWNSVIIFIGVMAIVYPIIIYIENIIKLYSISNFIINFVLIIIFILIYIKIKNIMDKEMEEHKKIDELLKDILILDLSEQEIRKRMEELGLLPPPEDEGKKVKTTPDGRPIRKKKKLKRDT